MDIVTYGALVGKVKDTSEAVEAANEAASNATAAADKAEAAADEANEAIEAIYQDKNFILSVNDDNSLTLTYNSETEE